VRGAQRTRLHICCKQCIEWHLAGDKCKRAEVSGTMAPVAPALAA